MTLTFFATKRQMGQAWTKSGMRVAITKVHVEPNMVLGRKEQDNDGYQALQIAYGKKKLKNMTKPLKTKLEKSGFSLGAKQIREIDPPAGGEPAEGQPSIEVGQNLPIAQMVKVGDLVQVQGRMKGRGWAGVIKRHGFAGGPKTHGQSDRHRAPGAIGNRTTPGRVFKGKRMAGHYGDTLVSVKNLQVVYMNEDATELWLAGPVPGSINGTLRLYVMGHKEFEGLNEVSQPAVANPPAGGPAVETAEVEATEETKVEAEAPAAEAKAENPSADGEATK